MHLGASSGKNGHHLGANRRPYCQPLFPVPTGSDVLKAAKLNIEGRTNADIELVKVRFPR